MREPGIQPVDAFDEDDLVVFDAEFLASEFPATFLEVERRQLHLFAPVEPDDGFDDPMDF